MMFISVDFPEPEAPTIATISPLWRVSEMSLSTASVSLPARNVRQTWRKTIIGSIRYPRTVSCASTTRSPTCNPSSTSAYCRSLIPMRMVRVRVFPFSTVVMV